MTQAIDATYQDGVFIPVQKPALAEHERVRLTIESIGTPVQQDALTTVQQRRQNRLCIDETLAREIANDPGFDLLESP
ncbi:MAG TPA: antitoxin family protein [Tepidisphaeraceae bacterium]|jgi:predicted DNA-binding antitoxin AbrB/MazE fold protein|nr:antitoxin family protein [Tepidisphaeraceae bacterium]